MPGPSDPQLDRGAGADGLEDVPLGGDRGAAEGTESAGAVRPVLVRSEATRELLREVEDFVNAADAAADAGAAALSSPPPLPARASDGPSMVQASEPSVSSSAGRSPSPATVVPLSSPLMLDIPEQQQLLAQPALSLDIPSTSITMPAADDIPTTTSPIIMTTPPTLPKSREPRSLKERLDALVGNPPPPSSPSPSPSTSPSSSPSGPFSSSFPSTSSAPVSPLTPSPISPHPRVGSRPTIKVKTISWNMGDALMKGDLEVLLGHVPPYDPPVPTLPLPGEPMSLLPQLEAIDAHPYHLVVVAGQECPTTSGLLPRGFGAAWPRDPHRKRETLAGSSTPDLHSSAAGAVPATPVTSTSEASVPGGWTGILEQWFCHGAGACTGAAAACADASPSPPMEELRPPASAPSMLPSSSTSSSGSGGAGASTAGSTPAITTPVKPQLMKRHFSKSSKLERGLSKHSKVGSGPYELLTKERLLGIYVAVFVYKGCKHLIGGVSAASVTAGLLGGRLGNKGAVGVSLKLAETRLLFVNAHLAAHEHRLAARLENMEKIRACLGVDAFLPAGDPRNLCEDVSERFDFTWLMGDLNMRVDITRKHADWLMMNKEYKQALEFDQLRRVMKSGEGFQGFHEAEIAFPPTFKYDVLHTLKRSRSRQSRRKSMDSRKSDVPASSRKSLDSVRDDPLDADNDASSIVSSTWNSVRSSVYAPTEDEDEDEDEALREAERNAQQLDRSLVSEVDKAVDKAKNALKSLVRPRLPSAKSPSPSFTTPKSQKRVSQPLPAAPPHLPLKSTSSLDIPRPSPHTLAHAHSPRSPPPPLKRGLSKRLKESLAYLNRSYSDEDSGDSAEMLEEEIKDEPQPFDSSPKQRVPSWCDRILWRSTLEPEPEPEPVESGRSRKFSKFGSALFDVLRRKSSHRSSRELSLTASTSSRQGSRVIPPFPGSGSLPASPAPSSIASLEGTRTPPAADVQALSLNAVAAAATPHRERRKLFSRLRSKSTTTSSNTAPFIHSSGMFSSPSFPPSGAPSATLNNALGISPLSTPPAVPSPLGPNAADHPLLSSALMSSEPATPLGTPPPSTAGADGLSTVPLSTAPASASTPGDAPSSPSAPIAPLKPPVGASGTPRWAFWHSLPAFLTTSHRSSSFESTHQHSGEPAPPAGPRRGDVLCLSYTSLSDREMRRLEGRSDHRPVIGAYLAVL